MHIANYSEDRAVEIAELYHRAVHAIEPHIYSEEQQEAWAPSPPDSGYWVERLRTKTVYLAIIDDRVAGFMAWEADGHIDCVYTHPEFQGRGVASALYRQLLAEAKNQGIERLYVEASLIARPFFARKGFKLVKINNVCRGGILLENFTMAVSI